MYTMLSTAGDPTSLTASAIRATSALDQSVPVLDVRTMSSRIRGSLEERRFATVLLEVLGGVALVLTVIGIYGLVSYRVSRSVRELGLRMALGASTGTILRSVLRHGAGLASVGVAMGIGAAFLTTGLVGPMLFGVEAVDGATYATVATGLVLTCLIASYFPARRAAAVDPLEVIKSE